MMLGVHAQPGLLLCWIFRVSILTACYTSATSKEDALDAVSRKDWSLSRPCLSQLGAGKAAEVVRFPWRGWLSHQAVHLFAAFLVRDMLNVEVRFVDVQTASQKLHWLSDMADQDLYDLDLEFWATDDLTTIQAMQDARVRVLGNTGYRGRSGIYVSNRTLAKWPMIDFYRALRDPRIASPPFNFPLSSESNFEGASKFWRPSQCQNSTVPCLEFAHIRANYDQTYVEQLVTHHHLPVVVLYLGSSYYEYIRNMQSQKRDFLAYFHSPDPFLEEVLPARVSFPDYVAGCDLGSNLHGILCDFKEVQLKKVARNDFSWKLWTDQEGMKGKRAFHFASGFRLSLLRAKALMNAVVNSSSFDELASSVCAFLKINKKVYQTAALQWAARGEAAEHPLRDCNLYDPESLTKVTSPPQMRCGGLGKVNKETWHKQSGVYDRRKVKAETWLSTCSNLTQLQEMLCEPGCEVIRDRLFPCAVACMDSFSCADFNPDYDATCQPCRVVGCQQCDKERPDVCLKCHEFFFLSAEGQCLTQQLELVIHWGPRLILLTVGVALGVMGSFVLVLSLCDKHAQQRDPEYKNLVNVALQYHVNCALRDPMADERPFGDPRVPFSWRLLSMRIFRYYPYEAGLMLYENSLWFLAAWVVVFWLSDPVGLWMSELKTEPDGSKCSYQVPAMVDWSARYREMHKSLFWVMVRLFFISLTMLLIFAKYQWRMADLFDRLHSTMTDFAVWVDGLPATATNEAELESFFEGILAKPIEGVSICYALHKRDTKEVHELLNEAEDGFCSDSMDYTNDCPEHSPATFPGKEDWQARAKAKVKSLRSSGTAIVVCKTPQDAANLYNTMSSTQHKFERGEHLHPVYGLRMLTEPPTIAWENFHCLKHKVEEHHGPGELHAAHKWHNYRKVAAASVVIVLCWSFIGAVFYSGFYWYLTAYLEAAKRLPEDNITFILFGILISIGNAILNQIIWFISGLVRFRHRTRRYIMVLCWYFGIAFCSIVVNLYLIFAAIERYEDDKFLASQYMVQVQKAKIIIDVATSCFLTYLVWPLFYPWQYLSSRVSLFVFHKLARRKGKRLRQREAEQLLELPEVWIEYDYAALVLLPSVAFIGLFYADTVHPWRQFWYIGLWCFFTMIAQRIIVFRHSRATYFTGSRLELWAQRLMGIPLCIVATCAIRFGLFAWGGRDGQDAWRKYGPVWIVLSAGITAAIYLPLHRRAAQTRDEFIPFGIHALRKRKKKDTLEEIDSPRKDHHLLHSSTEDLGHDKFQFQGENETYEQIEQAVEFNWFNTNPVHVLKRQCGLLLPEHPRRGSYGLWRPGRARTENDKEHKGNDLSTLKTADRGDTLDVTPNLNHLSLGEACERFSEELDAMEYPPSLESIWGVQPRSIFPPLPNSNGNEVNLTVTQKIHDGSPDRSPVAREYFSSSPRDCQEQGLNCNAVTEVSTVTHEWDINTLGAQCPPGLHNASQCFVRSRKFCSI